MAMDAMAPPRDPATAPAAKQDGGSGGHAAMGGLAPEICLWCGKGDYILHYGPRMLLTCDMCLQAYCHVGCDAVRHSRPPLTAKQVNSDVPWFCCTDCAEVAAALADETNAPRRPLDEHPQYTFELVHHDPSLPAGRDAGCADYTASVVASAVKIFATSFAPLILDDGRDMMELICNSHFDPNGSDNIDYSAFRVAALRHRNTVVSVATVRVFGRGVAEMPFVATREAHRKAGNMRRLVSSVEDALRRWGVRRLVLPAITDVEHIWTRHFGMARMTPASRAEIEDLVVTPESSTAVMLWKDLTATATATPAPKAAPAGPLTSAPMARRVVGEGTFASLAQAATAAVAATTAAKPTAAETAAMRAAADTAAAHDEAVGHALADALLSTLSDVDDERRAAQAAQHGLKLRCAAQAARIAALEAALRSVASGADAADALAAIPAAEAEAEAEAEVGPLDIEAEEQPAATPYDEDAAAAPMLTVQALPYDSGQMDVDAPPCSAADARPPPDDDGGDVVMAAADAVAVQTTASAEAAPRKYFGVFQRAGARTWYFAIRAGGQRLRAAGFATAEAAARACDAACRANGRTDSLNFPEEVEAVTEAEAERAATEPLASAPPAETLPVDAQHEAAEAAVEVPRAEPPAEPLQNTAEVPAAPAPPSSAATAPELEPAAQPQAESAAVAAAAADADAGSMLAAALAAALDGDAGCAPAAAELDAIADAELALAPEAAPPAPLPPPPPAPAPRQYNGVRRRAGQQSWTVELCAGGERLRESGFASALEAALRHDELCRSHGRPDRINFPDAASESAAPAAQAAVALGAAEHCLPPPLMPAPTEVAMEAADAPPPPTEAASEQAALNVVPPSDSAAEVAAAAILAMQQPRHSRSLGSARQLPHSSVEDGAAEAAAARRHSVGVDADLLGTAAAACAPRQYNGVRQRASRRTWEYSLRVAGERMRKGGFETAEEAARAYDAACRARGRTDRLNFPTPGEAAEAEAEAEGEGAAQQVVPPADEPRLVVERELTTPPAAASQPSPLAVTPLGEWLASLRLGSQQEAPPAEEAAALPPLTSPPPPLRQEGHTCQAAARFSSGALREACSAMFTSPPSAGDGGGGQRRSSAAEGASPPQAAADVAVALGLAWQASSEFAAQ